MKSWIAAGEISCLCPIEINFNLFERINSRIAKIVVESLRAASGISIRYNGVVGVSDETEGIFLDGIPILRANWHMPEFIGLVRAVRLSSFYPAR